MSELSDINKHFNELNRDNGSNIPAGLYGKRRNMLKGKIHQYNTHNGTDIRLSQPDQFVRAFNLVGMPG